MISKHIQSMGTDVELFLKDKQGRLQSAIGLIGGDKENPLDVPYGNLQEDNVLAEFAINPADTPEKFHQYIQSVAKSLVLALPGYKFSHRSFHYMPHRLMDSDKANEFGCDPDLDSYSLTTRTPPTSEQTKFKRGCVRSAGGHLHFGLKGINVNHQTPLMSLARALDFYVGLPLRLADPCTVQRDKIYGGYGAIRTKPYGFEYRTPSNYWIFNHDRIEWVLRNSVKAIETMFGYSSKRRTSNEEAFIVRRADVPSHNPDWAQMRGFARYANGLTMNKMDRLVDKYQGNMPRVLEAFIRQRPQEMDNIFNTLGLEPVPTGGKVVKKEAA